MKNNMLYLLRTCFHRPASAVSAAVFPPRRHFRLWKQALILIALCAALSACSQQEEPLCGVRVVDRVSFAESEMLVNTPAHQAYVEKYMYPFATSGLFGAEFSPDDMSAFNQMSPSLFGYIYLNDNPGNDLGISDEESEVPGDMLESTMTAYLPLTPAQIRAAFAPYYDADRHMYTAAFGGLGGGPAEFIINESHMEDGLLFLSYDAYCGDYDTFPWPEDEFHWLLYQHGKLRIETDGDSFRFLSNALQKGPGIE